MFVVVNYDRVLVDELEVSEVVSFNGGVKRIHVIQSHPTFLVEFPWLIYRSEVHPKSTMFRLYLEPSGRVVNDLLKFLDKLETTVGKKISDKISSHSKIVEQHNASGHGGRFISIRIPPADLHRCFDTTAKDTKTYHLTDIRRGMYVKAILDFSEVLMDDKKWGFVPKLFQMQVKTCPPMLLMPSSSPLPMPKAVDTKTATVSSSQATVIRKKFVPNLEEIIKKKNELGGRKIE